MQSIQNNKHKTITLFCQPYLDLINQNYKNIVTVNLIPQGPLGNMIRRIKFPSLSPFQQNQYVSQCNNCGLALISFEHCNLAYVKNGTNLMIVDEVPNLFSFLLSNGYTIDTSITNMLNESGIKFNTETGKKIIAVITYNGV